MEVSPGVAMKIAIASGKGGTGKTTVATNLALSLENVQLLDCDVEEPNDHVLLRPMISDVEETQVLVPKIVEERCQHCGDCADFCAFNALFVAPEKVVFFPELCHSCGGCLLVCPHQAIIEEAKRVGVIKRGRAQKVELVYGELDVGEPMAVPLIRAVKSQIEEDRNVIVDSPPGTACPVVASVYGSDFCVLVTEPTPFGLHDLQITVQVVRALEIPLGVVVNMAGIGDRKVYEYCATERIPILLEVPFNKRIAELYSRGIPFVEEMAEWKEKFRALWRKIAEDV